MYSMHSSRENFTAGAMFSLLSVPLARMLVSCLPLRMFTTRSSVFGFSPITWPMYTSSPGSTKKRPRSCSLLIEKATAVPVPPLMMLAARRTPSSPFQGS